MLREVLGLLAREKKWWLIPLAAGLVLVSALVLFERSTATGPYLYPSF